MTRPDGGHTLITGNREMDEEHALQLRLLLELMQSLDSHDGATATELFERLDHFTNEHFLAEELLMRLHGYPAFEAHSAEHGEFIEELKALRTRLASDGTGAVQEDADAFSRKLLAHIATADHALGAFHRSGATSGA